MSRKTILTMLSLLAMSAAAQAAPIITDKGYWPNEAHSSVYAGDRPISREPASAYNWIAPQAQPAPSVSGGSPLGRYHGGPKSR